MSQDLVIRQYVYQTESWGRLLTFFPEEKCLFQNEAG